METLRPGVIGTPGLPRQPKDPDNGGRSGVWEGLQVLATGHCAGLPNPTWNPKMWMKVGLGVRVSVLDPHLTVGVL